MPKRYEDYDMSNIAYALLSEDPILQAIMKQSNKENGLKLYRKN